MAVITDKEAVNRSDFKSAAWRCQEQAWKITSDLWRSALHVRKQREEYLEKFKKEKAEKYDERLNRSVFTNKFRESIETMGGMVFKSDPAPEEAPTAIAELFTDIDGCGNSLHSFLLKAFEMFLRDGDGHIFIDAPQAPALLEGERLTQAQRPDDRPIWIFYEASQIISKRYETIGGQEVLSQVVIEENILEPAGLYGEKSVKKHRILRRGSFVIEVYDKEKDEWIIESEGVTGLEDIPFVSFAEYGTAPPLLVLAMLNQLYYNLVSDFDSWVHMACVPHQVIKVGDESDAKKFRELNKSAEVATIIFGEHSNVFYVEVTGDGLDIADKRINQLESQMSALGVGMLQPTELAPKSATEVMDTAGQRQSKLARFAREFENAIEKAFWFTAEQWNVIRPNLVDLGEAEKASLKLKMDFDRLTFNIEQIAFFERIRTSGNLSRLTFFELLQNIWDMPKGWEPKIEVQRLKDEAILNPAPAIPEKLQSGVAA